MRKGSAQYIIAVIIMAVSMPAGAVSACEWNKCSSISIGELIADNISDSKAIHAFGVSVEAGDAIIVRANRTSGAIDPQITLLHPSGYIIATDGAAGSGRAEVMSQTLLTSDTYTILINDVTAERPGGYNLTVQSIIDPVDAATIYYDTYRSDSLRSYAQMNAYRFQASAGDIISIEMIDAGRPLTPSLRLFAPDGTLVGADIDPNFALISNVVLRSTGKYTIIATDALGDEVGSYFLVLLKSTTDADDNDGSTPAEFAVGQNYPNPFNPRTTISFSLPRTSMVTIDVFNLLGEKIRTLVSQTMPPGDHSVVWDGSDGNGGEVSSGVYFYRLRADEFSATKKMVLLR